MFGILKGIVRLSASAVAIALGIPLYLAQEALDAGCETLDEVRDYIQTTVQS